MPDLVNNVLDLIGNTPIVSLTSLGEPGCAQILGKLESRNPGGSVKDRVALAMIEDAEARGAIRPGHTIVEASGGNLGIALAVVGAAKGYHVLIVMPEGVSSELRTRLERFGASVQLTPSNLGMKGAHVATRRLVEETRDHVSLNQFENPSNAKAHREGTAQEILKAMDGKVDAFVAGVGTGGTITGVGEVLKAENPSVQVVAVEPASSPLLSEGRAGRHYIPGIGADFIPPILNREIIDEVMAVTEEQAADTAQRLTRELGLLAGLSSGANVFASLVVAKRLGQHKVVVTMLPDTGERYK